MDEISYGEQRILSPKTVEEMLLAIGWKERDPDLVIVLSVEIVADICVRLIRLEDKEGNKGGGESSETEG